MARTLKVLGLALAASALAAVMASSALAGTHHFTVSETPAWVIGTQETENPPTVENHFTTTNNSGTQTSTVSCKEAKYEGTTGEATRAELTVTPTYPAKTVGGAQNCEFGGGIGNAEVRPNHCAFNLTGGPTDANGDAPVGIECEVGNKLEVEAGGCTIKIGEQSGAELEKGAHYVDTTNGTTTKKNITIEATVTSIAYEKVGPVLNCAFAGNGTSGHFTAKITATAFKDNELNIGTAKTTPVVNTGAEIGVEGNTNAT
jgi:hypothetical protein